MANLKEMRQRIVQLEALEKERRRASEELARSEAIHCSLVENAGAGIAAIDIEGRFTMVNDALCIITGCSAAELVGSPFTELLHQDDRERVVDIFRSGLTGERRQLQIEFRVVCKDGGVVWCCANPAAVICDNELQGFSAIINDITDRKEMEMALRHSEHRFRTAIAAARDGILLTDTSERVVDVNEAFVKALGFNSRDEMVGRSVRQFLSADTLSNIDRGLRNSLSKVLREGRGYVTGLELVARAADGRTIPVELNISRMVDQQGELTGFLHIVRDITERKRAEEALRESQRLYRLVAENVHDVIWVMDLELRTSYLSPSIVKQRGYTAEETMKQGIDQVLTPASVEKAWTVLAEELANESDGQHDPSRSRTLELECFCKDGSTIWVEEKVSFLRDAHGAPVGILGVSRNITERRRAEEALRESEEKYRNLVERANDGIVILQDGIVKYANQRAMQLGDYSVGELTGMPFTDFIHPDEGSKVVERYRRRMMGEDVEPLYETVLRGKYGNDIHVELNAGVVTYEDRLADYVFIRDITSRKRGEEALRASEERYRLLVDNANEAILVAQDGLFKFANPKATGITGYSADDLAMKPFAELIHPDDREMVMDRQRRRLRGEEIIHIYPFRIVDKAGNIKWVQINAVLITWEGRPATLNFISDISEQKRAEEQLQNHMEQTEALYAVARTIGQTQDIEQMVDAVLEKTVEVLQSDAALLYLLDESSSELTLRAYKGVSIRCVLAVGRLELNAEETGKPVQGEGSIAGCEGVIGRRNLSRVASALKQDRLEWNAVVPLRLKGAVTGVLAVACRRPREYSAADVELVEAIGGELVVGMENARLLTRTREMSVTDELTGLYNRRHFYEVLESEMERTRRYGRSFSLALLNFDGFKEYNDRFGHTNGDMVLRAFAAILKSSLRKSDVAFRYGGDDFAIILPLTEAENARRIINRVRLKWLKASRVENTPPGAPLAFSAGIAQIPDDAETADGLVFLADTALYHSKREGGHRLTLASELKTMDQSALSRVVMEQVYALASTVDARDPYTYGHSERVAQMSGLIGRAAGLKAAELAKLQAAALLHDVGKVGVPDSILTKPGKLTLVEWQLIERHPVEGAKIVSHVRDLVELVPMIRHHHERYDGSGYPDGLRGEEIPLGARIVSIADAYDTMTTLRPYRHPVTRDEALEELRRCSGTQFDPVLVEAFYRMAEERLETAGRVGGEEAL